MRENEICFIMCTNNKLYAEECEYYIRHLHVPDGYCIDILAVEGAASMTAGYNEAMRQSDAKYKVYLHQDVFLIRNRMIDEFIDVFTRYPDIGMLGVVGAPKLPEHGVMWDVQRYGMIFEQHIFETQLLFNGFDEPYKEMQAIDGMLMVTQYDVPWREDLFQKWDFYDASQSMEFIRHGYKVAVPKMETPWCLHDCGFLNMENYEEQRKIFVQEYMEG